ncbi:SecDF P1 head subdomain-containing protein [Bradyrhizobium sp. Arg314]
MVYLSRLKVILIGLALIAMVFGASNAFASISGTHILLRLDTDELINRRLEATRDQIRMLLRDVQPRINFSGLAVSGLTVQLRIGDPVQVEAAKAALKAVVDPIAGKEGPVQEFALDDSEPGLLKFMMTDAGANYRMSAALAQSIEVIKNRLHELGIADSAIQLTDEGIVVQAPGAADLLSLARTLARPGRLSFQLVDTSMPVNDAINSRPPAGSSVLYSMDDPPVPYLVENRVIVSGDRVLDARAALAGEPVVAFRLDSRGTERFKWATTQYVGKPFAMILDGQVISAPIVREPIESGTGQISGSFTDLEAKTIALLMRTGALPARLTIVEEAR